MRIAVLSDTRRATRPDGHHGLGKTVHDIATGLASKGYDVTLCGHPDSTFEKILPFTTEMDMAVQVRGQFDIFLDSTHQHLLSQMEPGYPVVNRVCDMECDKPLPNAVVESRYMQDKRPGARYIRKGIDVDGIPFEPRKHNYFLYMSQLVAWKGVFTALELAQSHTIHFVGKNNYQLPGVPNYHGEAVGVRKWRLLGHARALLHLSTGGDASPRTPLEAAACGTMTLCLDGDGTREHVADGVTGFVCENVDDMMHCEPLEPRKMREWVAENHALCGMINAYECTLIQVARGERW